jgi:nitric oxide reductase NorF protein
LTEEVVMSASTTLIACWLGLAVLSFASVQLGSAGATLLMVCAVLLAALGKAWLIADGFMELRHAPPMWRWLILSWPVVMAAGVLLALSVSL